MYPNCVPDITMLVQAVLQVFCSQYCFTIRCQSQKRKMIQSNIYRILPKVHVIYTFNTICKQTIMIQVQAIQIFCSQGSIGLQSASRKRDTTATSLTNRKKIYGSALILFMLSLYINLEQFLAVYKRNGQTYVWSWGHKNQLWSCISKATFGFLPAAALVILPLVPLATIEPWTVLAANDTIGKNIGTIGKNERCTRQLNHWYMLNCFLIWHHFPSVILPAL